MRYAAPQILALALALLFPTAGAAQVDDEARFLGQQASALHKFAAAALKAGFPSMAKPILLEILSEYDKDHEKTRKALGYKRFNTTWELEKEFPEGDQANPGAAKSLGARWQSTAKAVGGAHKKLAMDLKTAGRADRAKYHFGRALRFLPGDEEVQAEMGHKSFGGMTGSDLEQKIFDRSKAMDQAIVRLRKLQPEVKTISDAPPPPMAKAGITCNAVQSEHFRFFGPQSVEELTTGAKNAERALKFCQEFFTGHQRFDPKNVRVRDFVFTRNRDQYLVIMQKNPQLGGKRRNFLLQHRPNTAIQADGKRFYLANGRHIVNINDTAVRWVTQQYSTMQTAGMQEGIGHTVVGRFFGRNLAFTIGQATGTVTKGGRRLLLPDMDTWKELAIEAAFNPRGTKAAQLPLLKAARFPTDGRIKAWSFCDYLLRIDPLLLLNLDSCGKKRNPGEVTAMFDGRSKIPLVLLEKGWKDFWTGATPVLKALRNRAEVLNVISKGSAKWVDALNKARAAFGTKKVSWSASYSKNCKQHVEYLGKNRRERNGLEHFQREGQPGATGAGNLFALWALVSTKGSPSSAMKNWIHVPGYRDALLNPYLESVGAYASGSIAVLDVIRGVNVPRGNVKGVAFPTTTSPKSISTKLLGPEVAAELKKRKVRGKTIGYPVTFHGWASGAVPSDIKALVIQGGERVEGFVIAGRGTRYAAAPGMIAFYPLAPFKSGQRVIVEFHAAADSRTIAKFAFTPK